MNTITLWATKAPVEYGQIDFYSEEPEETSVAGFYDGDYIGNLDISNVKDGMELYHALGYEPQKVELKILDNEYNSIQRQTFGWRRVKDELPETNNEVLADIVNVVGEKAFHEHAIAYFNKDKGQWFTVDGEAVNVVNWMPLPELPKNE
jgi:hypothetical protein